MSCRRNSHFRLPRGRSRGRAASPPTRGLNVKTILIRGACLSSHLGAWPVRGRDRRCCKPAHHVHVRQGEAERQARRSGQRSRAGRFGSYERRLHLRRYGGLRTDHQGDETRATRGPATGDEDHGDGRSQGDQGDLGRDPGRQGDQLTRRPGRRRIRAMPRRDVCARRSRGTLYCSTNGPAYRANGDGMGIALNLPDSQGALMVQLGS